MFDKAKRDYLKAIELNPNETEFYLKLGNLYIDGFNELEKAIAEYLKILDFDPKDIGALNNIGSTYLYDLKNFEKAEEYYLKAIDRLNIQATKFSSWILI